MDYQRTIDKLIEHEGFRAHPYRCTADTWTIGYGSINIYVRGVPPKAVTAETFPITKFEARANLLVYMDKAFDIAKLFVKNFDEINSARQSALVMMAYQLGYRLHQFKNTKYFIERSAWPQAADEMLDSKWKKQTPKRAREMAHMIQTGAWL